MSKHDQLRELLERILVLSKENSVLTEKIDLFFDNPVTGIILIDERGVIAGWNKQVARVTGLSGEQVSGKFIWDVQAGLLTEDLKGSHSIDFLKQAWQREVFVLQPGAETRGYGRIINSSGREQYIEDLAVAAFIGGKKYFVVYQNYIVEPGGR